MGKVFPFSAIDQYLGELGDRARGCIVDTNFLIAAIYDNHPFYDDAGFLFEKLSEYKIPVFSTVTTRSEFMDIRRRIIITEVLMDMLTSESPWRLSAETMKELKKHRTWIDIQAAKDDMPILTDARIKQCKNAFMPQAHSGKTGWIEICRAYLTGTMTASWKLLVDQMGINHLDLNDPKMQPFVPEKVEWNKMYSISETTCLSSSDAMILNMLKCSVFPFVVSADYDMAYAMLVDDAEKVVLIPDSLYREKIKGRKFI